MSAIEVTDQRIIGILANSVGVMQNYEPLLEKLKNLKPVNIFSLKKKLNPPQQTNYQTLYIRVIEFWKSRAGTTGTRGASPSSLSNIIRESMELPRLADQIDQDILPLFAQDPKSKWWVDAAKLLAQNDGTASDRWIELATFMGIESDIPCLRMVKDADFRTFWLEALKLFNNVNELKFDKVKELQRALEANGLMNESYQIERIIQGESEVDGMEYDLR
ncbi:Formin-H [Orchesella cincta]|uniref:Formin-H n=1 Tax=Orchesella cincta TaxID=48709 RepID=A0A1D2M4Q9_ORCCI|nr:Formin-H [Orchesella cincta]